MRQWAARNGRWAAAGLIVIMAAALLSGAPVARAAPPPPALNIPITEEVLPNGLKVLIIEAPKAPVVTVQVWYRVGSRNEVPGVTGLSHMVEHMMFKGTPSVPIKQFDRLIAQAGGNSNAFTNQDATTYFENLASDRLELALRLEADRMANVLFDEKEFAAERDVVVEERRLRQEDEPLAALSELLYPTVFVAHPYAHPIIGWMSDIKTMRLDDLRRHYTTYYAPNNVTLVVGGDVRPAEVLPLVRRYFGGIARGAEPPPVRAARPPQQGERRVTLRKEAQLPHLLMAWPIPNAKDKDSLALDMLEIVLSGGRSSRLYRRLVQEQQIALGVSANNNRLSIDPQLFTISATPLPGKTAEELEKALDAEIEQVQREPVTPQELEKALNQVEADFIMGQDSVYNLARTVMSFELITSWRDFGTYLADLYTVTVADVQRVAQRYLVKDQRSVATLVPIKPGS